MTIFIMILSLIINIILESTIVPHLSFLGVVPNTALIIIVVFALLKGKYYGAFSGLLFGLVQDIMFSTTIGINALILFFLGYLIGLIEDKLTRDNLLIPIVFSVLGTLFYHGFYYVCMFFLSRNIPLFSLFKQMILIEIIYNGIISIFIYQIFRKIFVVPTIRFKR